MISLRRALAKPHLRLAAVDDGPFTRRHRYAPVVGIVVSLPATVEAIAVSRVRVDGRDATDRVVALLRQLPPLEGVRAIVVDGIAVGGFNVLDLDRVAGELRRPVVSVTRRSPDYRAIERALRTYFPRDAERRWRLIRAHRLFPVPTGGAPLWATAVGCTRADAVALLRRAAEHGYWPEPLRLAHLIARASAEGFTRKRPFRRPGL
ncbi:MAG TPA: DUF99 family protein [Thermoplasmata archaeon]|nr:DUF99 family protein [Thermoplasmata archaeon]